MSKKRISIVGRSNMPKSMGFAEQEVVAIANQKNQVGDFILDGYDPHPPIKGDIAV